MIAILSAMLPLYGGMPVVIMGILSGLAGCLVCGVGWNVWCNLADAAAGKERCSGMAAAIMHMKRPGERFTTRQLGPGRVSINDDDEFVAEDGSEYFVPDGASGVSRVPRHARRVVHGRRGRRHDVAGVLLRGLIFVSDGYYTGRT